MFKGNKEGGDVDVAIKGLVHEIEFFKILTKINSSRSKYEPLLIFFRCSFDEQLR
jgi:hypothetical protein